MRFWLLIASALAFGCSVQNGFNGGGLRFTKTLTTLPNSYQRIRNTFSEIEAPFVHSFSIEGGECQVQTIDGYNDCNFGSVRSMLRELHQDGRWDFAQPQEAVYSWDMLIPQEFPTHGTQTRGSYIFAQWKGPRCPHASIAHSTDRTGPNILYLRLQTSRGDPEKHDCADLARVPLMRMSDFKGQWHNITVRARWSSQTDGQIQVFIDGKPKGEFKGATLTHEFDGSGQKSEENHFDIGVYLCCTGGTRLVRPGTVYFANVKREAVR